MNEPLPAPSVAASVAPHHRDMLAASGISSDDAARRGYRTCTAIDKPYLAELRIAAAGRGTPGLLIPLLRPDGSSWGYQYRPDEPRLRKGKPVKYETPSGQRNGLDVPPGVGPMLGDPSIPLWITEGTKKADCGALRGLCIVALTGVWNWKGTNDTGGKVALSEFADVALNGRNVIIAFDGDAARKASVQQAMTALAGYLRSKGAVVEYLHLPDTDDKTGLDDYLAEHTVGELRGLVSSSPPAAPNRPEGAAGRLDDAHIAQFICDATLSDRYCWCGGMGWMRYTGTHWQAATDAEVGEQVRQAVIALHAAEARGGADADRLKSISALFGAGRIRAVVSLAKGIVEVRPEEFDAHPDLLNAGNGVVDLRTGTIAPHDPGFMFTKSTAVEYHPDAVHPDWTAALAALPEEPMRWMQQRIGQAATGYPTPDDVLPVLQGSGANGKSTFLTPMERALGDFATVVPERVLLANPSDHPTEMMTLRGARLAVMEETPEARHLNVKRLKDTLGTEVMTARLIAKDTVSWSPTHSLVLSTNYRPRVDEVDHGTWRRLALVRFPYTYRKPDEPVTAPGDRRGDPTLRDRLKRGHDGRHEAVLAWIVAGAVQWYASGRILPPTPADVVTDTRAWRADADAVLAFVTDRLVRDAGAHVMSRDLLAAFNGWLQERGHKGWSDQTLAGRLRDHDSWQGVEYRQISASEPGISRPGWLVDSPPARYRAWMGVRFRRDDEPIDDGDSAGNSQDAQGAQGTPTTYATLGKIESPDNPVHLVHPTLPRRQCDCGRPGLVIDESGLCQYCSMLASKAVVS